MASDGTTRAKVRVLVVDDYVDAVELLAEALSLSGYDVLSALDGASGIELFSSEQPVAVFVDIGMPGMDGYEVARRIRAQPTGGKAFLVALTGHSGDAERRRTADAGFDLHLVKPVDLGKVAALLDERFSAHGAH